jgi:hypothetical protein
LQPVVDTHFPAIHFLFLQHLPPATEPVAVDGQYFPSYSDEHTDPEQELTSPKNPVIDSWYVPAGHVKFEAT